MSGHSVDYDAGACGATHDGIDNGAPCKYLAGHLDAGIPHTTANGFWWADATPIVEPVMEGCDCTELCEMGPTCPGGMLAGLPGSGCARTRVIPPGEGRS